MTDNLLQNTGKPTVLLFIKAPRLGTVKTRLAKTIGQEQALRIFKNLVTSQIKRLPENFHLEVHYTPNEAKEEVENWLGAGITLIPQVEGDLGHKLSTATHEAFERGAGSVYCIGGDCPGLTREHFHAAEERISATADLCFGPTEDGGYYLLAMRAPQPAVFAEIPWSTADTLTASISQAKEHRLQVELLEELYDIDKEADLKRANQEGLL